MQLLATLIAILLSLPSYGTDHESPDVRKTRMTIVALSIFDASSRATCTGMYDVEWCEPITTLSQRELAFSLVVLGFHESRFARHIHEGKCRPGECDEVVIRNPLTGQVTRRYFRARSMWQVQRTKHSRPDWDRLDGLDFVNTRLAAWSAAKSFAAAHNRCRSRTGAFSGYAGSSSCRWSGATKRVHRLEALLRMHPEPQPMPESETALAAR